MVGLAIAGFGQGFAYNLSNTAGMESMPDEKAGVASGVLQTARLMGIVIGLALSGSLFTGLEHRELVDQARSQGATAVEIADVRGLLSGSASAVQTVEQLEDTTRAAVESITEEAFTYALRAVMLLAAVLSFAAVWPVLWGRRRGDRASHHARPAHPLWSTLWRRTHTSHPEPSPPAS